MKDTSEIEAFAEEFEAGHVLFEEGEDGDKMYVVQTGRVAISRSYGTETKILAKLPAGEFFGEMAILNDRPRSATATVIEPARLLVINGRTFEEMVRSRAEIAVRLIKTMADRLEQANRQVELLLVGDKTHRVVMALRQLAEDSPDYPTTPREGDPGIYINISVTDLASRVAVPRGELLDILQRLALARLVLYAEEAGIETEGFVIPEVGRLLEFLEFLDLKDRYGPVEDL